MSIRDRASPQQVLAVALALVMLVSMGGMAFVGGAGAQNATGGTYDQVFDESDDIGGDLNVGSNQVLAVSPDAGPAGDEVDVQSNGDVDLTGTADAGEFVGVSLTTDRIANLSGVEADAASEPATFLDEAPAEFDTNSDATTSAVFIEFAPQSNFSQIEKDAPVDGSHDFIVVATVPADTDGEVDGLVDTDVAEADTDLAAGDVVALSVSNDGGDASSSLLASGSDYGAVFDDLVGSSDSDLQNENIDDFQYVAGTFDSDNPTLDQVRLGDDVSTFEAGQTVHSEKITLVDADDDSERYFNSITNAEDVAGTGDTIRLDDGTYETGVNLGTEGLTVQPDASGDVPTVDGTVTYAAANVTVDGIDIDGGHVASNAIESPTLTNSTVTNNAATAVFFGDASNATVTNNNIIDDTEPVDDNTGLDVSNGYETVTGNDIQDFQTQIAATADEDLDALLADNAFEKNPDSQAAVPVNGTDAVQGDTIYGSIDEADGAASGGDTVAVYGGTYDHSGSIDIATENVSLVDVEDAATIEDTVNLDGDTTTDGNLSVDGFTINGNLATNAGNPGAVVVTDTVADNFNLDNIAEVTLEDTDGDAYTTNGDTISITNADGQTYDVTAPNATLEGVTADASGATDIAIDINAADSGDIVVANSTVATDGNHGGINVATDTNVDTEESVTIFNNTVTGNEALTGDTAAVEITDIVTALEGNDYVVEDNSLTALDDGQAVRLIEDDDATSQNEEEELGSVRVIENEMRGGTQFTGLYYDLPETTSAAIEGNVIVGADVDGSDDSVGVEFSEVLDFGSGGIFGSGDALTFEDNVITGHAQLVADTGADDRTVLGSDYTAMYNNTELNNSFGTLVVGAENEAYSDTFDITSDIYANSDNGRTYLPGSVSEAADLVNDSDEADSQTVDLEVQTIGTDVGGPTTYDDAAPVTLPDREAITITGADDSITVETRFEIPSSTNENNHDISDLTIDADATTAIDIQSNNAQSDLDNLNVTSAGTGVNVDTDGDDVNVINVTNSEFSVSNSGIVLNTADSDDRDGFVIDNVEIDGPGIGVDESVGIDLTGVEKPGKEGLPVDLQVTNSPGVTNFETLVAVDSSQLDVDADSFLNGHSTTDVEIANNEFDRAVTVDDGSDNLYGSVDLAASDAADDATVTVQGDVQGDTAPDYEHDGVVTVDTPGVTIDGVDDPTIADGIDVTEGGVTIQTLAVNADGGDLAPSTYAEDAIIDSDTGALTVDSVTVTSTISSSTNDMPIGVAATGGSLTVDGSTIGETSGTTGTGIAVADSVGLTVTDSTLTGGVDGDDNGDTPAYGIDAADNTAPDIDSTTITGFDQAGVWIADDALSITGGEISANGAAGVTDNGVTNASAQYDIDGTTIANNTGDGVALEAVGLVLTDATVEDNTNGVIVTGADDVTVTNATVTANTGDDAAGIDVTDGNATVTDSTVTANDVGVALDLADASNSAVTLNEIANNGDGLVIADGADELTVTGNHFANDATDIENADDATLDGTLNYFGTAQGPASDAAAGVTDNVVYDPFLTEDQTDSTVSDITETRDFGHDVVLPAESTVSVGFPAEPNPERNQISDVFSEDTEGTLYQWNSDTDQFELVSSDTFENGEVDAFDGYVVDNQGETETALVEYQNERSPFEASRTFEFEEGLNFVPAQQAGTVNRALFPGGDTDYVAQPFATGENLYGDTDATQTRDAFTSPSADGFGGNFRSGVGDEVVHPHAAYLVTVNEDSNDGLAVSERIPAPDAPAVDNVDERTSSTISTVTNVQTGATYDSLASALDEVQDGQTLELGPGTFEDGFEQTVTNDDVTLRGAGDTATTIEDDLTIEGENVRLRGINVVGVLTLNGDGTTINQLDVTANSPGDVVVNGDDAQLDDVDAEGDVSVNGNNTQVQNTRAGGSLSVGTETSGTSLTNVGAGSFSGTSNAETSGLSQSTVTVSTAADLRDAATDSLGDDQPVGSETTIVVDSDIDLTDTQVDVTVDGVTIEGASGTETVSLSETTETSEKVFEIGADDVTLQDIGVTRTADTDETTVSQAIVIRDASGVTVDNVDVNTNGNIDTGIAVLDGGPANDNAGEATDTTITNNNLSDVEAATGINVAAAYAGEIDAVTVADNIVSASETGLIVSTTSFGLGAEEPGTFGAEGVTVEDNDFQVVEGAQVAEFADSSDDAVDVLDFRTVFENNDFEQGAVAFADGGDDVRTDTVDDIEFGAITSSVDDAEEIANDGDTVEVAAGTYDKSVTVATPNLTIEGPNAGVAGDSAERGDEASFAIAGDITVDGVTIDGFELTGSSTTEIQGSNTTIANSDINVPDGDAPFRFQAGSDDSVITQNQFADGTGGTYVLNARQDFDTLIDGVEITDNSFEDISGSGTTAIQAAGFTNADISGNSFDSIGEDAVRLAGNVSGTEVTDNEFTAYAQNAKFPAGAIVANNASGDNVDVSGNQFNDAGGDNIYVVAYDRNDPEALDLEVIAGNNDFDQGITVDDNQIIPSSE